jgi:hypothetical protein
MNEEFSEGGQPIHRYSEPPDIFTPADMSSGSLELITGHIEHHIGKPEHVLHELVSDQVHIDIHVVPPREDRPYYTLVTSGMSDLPMTVPEGAEECKYAELMLALPPTWPLDNDALQRPEIAWPISALQQLARFPHKYKTWLWLGHTMPNGDPPEPFAANTKLNGWMVAMAFTVSTEFYSLQVSPAKTIYFFSLLPLYPEEMALKLKTNAEEVLNRFARANYSEIINTSRKSVAKPWWNPF